MGNNFHALKTALRKPQCLSLSTVFLKIFKKMETSS